MSDSCLCLPVSLVTFTNYPLHLHAKYECTYFHVGAIPNKLAGKKMFLMFFISSICVC